MPKLTLCTHFYNGIDGLNQQLSEWRKLSPKSKELIEILLVDDYSSEKYVIDCDDLPIRLFRVTTDINWNMAGCKNLLKLQAKSNWMLFFDIDNYALSEELDLLIQNINKLDVNNVYMFPRIHNGEFVDPHINTFLVSKIALDKFNGFDEDFCGNYGFEDVLFHNQVIKYGFNRVLLESVKFYQHKARTNDLNRDLEINQKLIQAKAALGFPNPENPIRFEWVEINKSFTNHE